jgi:hypothetical protein
VPLALPVSFGPVKPNTALEEPVAPHPQLKL